MDQLHAIRTSGYSPFRGSILRCCCWHFCAYFAKSLLKYTGPESETETLAIGSRRGSQCRRECKRSRRVAWELASCCLSPFAFLARLLLASFKMHFRYLPCSCVAHDLPPSLLPKCLPACLPQSFHVIPCAIDSVDIISLP